MTFDPFAHLDLKPAKAGVLPDNHHDQMSQRPDGEAMMTDPFASLDLKLAQPEPNDEGVIGSVIGTAVDFGKSIAHGAAVSLPQMAGQAMQNFDGPGGTDFVRNAGQKLEQWGTENDAALPSLQESEASKRAREDSPWNPRGWGYQAGESLVQSVAPAAAVGGLVAATGAAPIVATGAGLATVGALFYGSTAEDTYRRAIDAGLSEDDAKTVSRITGSIEAGGEMIADAIPLHLFKTAAKPLKDQIVKSVLSKSGAKTALKEIFNVMLGEVSTEMGQQGGEAYAEKKYGVRDADIPAEMAAVVGPTLIVSTIFGAAGHVGGNIRKRMIENTLADPNAKSEDRAKAVATVAHEVGKLDPKLAEKFVRRAEKQMADGKPIILAPDSEYRRTILGENWSEIKNSDPGPADVDVLHPEQSAGEDGLGDAIPASPLWQKILDSENVPTEQPAKQPSAPSDAGQYGPVIPGLSPFDPVAEGGAQAGQLGDVIPQDSAPLPEVHPLDAAAHEAATSPENAKPEPTAQQLKNGKYEKGTYQYHGMTVRIENPAGSVREDKNNNPPQWRQEMQHHYGYVEGMPGADKDKLDILFGPDPDNAKNVYVIDQYGKNGKFDEHKPVAGVHSEAEALAVYNANYAPGWDGARTITAMPVAEFKKWGYAGGAKQGPLAEQEHGGKLPAAPEAFNTEAEKLQLTDDMTRLQARRDHLINIYGPIVKRWKDKPSITMVATEDALPSALQQDIREQRSGGKVRAAFHNGKLYMVAANIDSEQSAEQALLHEAIGHYGLRKLLGRDFDSAMKALSFKLGGRSGIIQKAESFGINLDAYRNAVEGMEGKGTITREQADEILVDELLAHLAERNLQPTLVQRIVAAIRQALRRLGLGNLLKLSDNDLINLVASARQAVVEGKSVAVYQDTRFSLRPAFNTANPAAISEVVSSGLEQAKQYAAARMDYLRTKFQDKFLPLKRTQEQLQARGWDKTESADAYLAEELSHGKIEQRLERFENEMVKPLTEAIAASNVSVQELQDYLYARHAAERNAYIQEINPEFEDGGSGMTDAEAAQVLDQFDQAGKTAELQSLARRVDAITAFQRATIVAEGLESPDVIDAWESRYQHYVPLKGAPADVQDGFGRRVGKGFDIRGKEAKNALGRRSEASNILGNLVAQTADTLIRAERAEVGRAFLEMVEQNPDRELWEVHTQGDWPTTRALRNGEVVEMPDHLWPISENVMAVKRDGQAFYVEIKDKPLATAMKNLTPNQSLKTVQLLGAVNRFLARINTTLNPEFMITNFERDLQTAAINLSGEHSAKLAGKVIKQVPAAMRGIFKGLYGNRPNEWTQWWERYKNAGAKVGFFGLESVEQQQKKIERLVKEAESPSKAKRFATAIFDFVDNANTVVENASRLSAFRAAIEAGLTEKQAASLAKNLTVNFNRKGEFSSAANAMYLFFNAGVQGTARLVSALKHKNVRRIAYGTMAAAFLLAESNRLAGGDDDDGENRWDKIDDYFKETNLIVMKSDGSGGFYKVKLPYGYNVFVSFGYLLSDLAHGASLGKATSRFTSTVLNAFNPLGGDAGLLQTVSPTLLDPFVQVATNENFFGAPIKPEQSPFGPPKPESQLYWSSVRPFSREVAKELNALTGGSEFEPGAIDVSPEVMDHFIDFFLGSAGRFYTDIADMLSGEDLTTRQIPFVRQVVQDPSEYHDLRSFKENSNTVMARRKTYQAMLQNGERGAALKYLGEHPEIRLYKRAQRTRQKLSDLYNRQQQVENAGLPASDKQEVLDRIEQRRQGLIDRFNLSFLELTP